MLLRRFIVINALHHLTVAAFACAALIIPFYSAMAETEKASELSDLSIEQLMTVEVTSVSKKAQSTHEAPASVNIITKEDIRRFGYRTLGEALRSVVGFYVSSDRNYDYLGARGFGRPGDYNTRILLLVDGHRVNDPNYDYAPIGEDLGVDLYSVEKIEISKGASSAVWGTNGLLAVINIITKKGRDMKGGDASVEYGSHNRTKGYIEYGKLLNNGFEFAGSLSGLDSKGERNIYFPEFDSEATNFGIAHGKDEEAAYRGYISASYAGATLLVTDGWRRKDIPTGPYGTAFNVSGTRTWDYSTRVDLSYTSTLDEKNAATIFSRVYYDTTHYYGHSQYITEGDGPTASYDSGNSKLIGTEFRYSQNLNKSLSLLMGVEAARAYDLTFSNFQYEPDYAPVLYSQSAYSLYSTFGELDYALMTNLHLIGGLRFDHYSTSVEKTSPRAALVYNATPSTTVKLLYGEAFRAPNNYERNYSDNMAYVGNSGLEPESVKSYELVVEQAIGTTSLSLSLFDYTINDIISQTTNADDLIQFQNLGKIESKGIELQSSSHFENDIILHTGFSLQRAEDSETGKRSSNSPTYLGVLGISIPVAHHLLYISPEMQAIGNRYSIERDTISSSYLTNLVLSSAKKDSKYLFSLGIYNLFDERSYSPGAEEHLQHLIPQDGRTILAKVETKF